MRNQNFIHSTRTFRILSLLVFLAVVIVGLVNQTEAAPPEQSGVQYKVCQNYDIAYVLDLSGSMSWGYGGAGSRLDAAKAAIVAMNDVLEVDGAGVEASLITWQGNNVNVQVDFTTNFNQISTVVNGLSASGTTPAADAIQGTHAHFLNNVDPDRQPVVLFITDGIPTRDLDGNYYWDYYVNDVPIINPWTGGYYSSNTVRYDGVYYSSYGRYAGYPLADAMNAIDSMTSDLSDLTMHSIAILGTDFRQDLLYYAADKGGGGYFGATNANQLAAALQQAVYEGDCPSTLEINVDNTAVFTLGGAPQVVDPNLTVTGDAENVGSATVQLKDNFDASTDSIFIGNTPANSGVVGNLTWWYDATNGTLEVVGVGTPAEYEAFLRQVTYANSATDDTSTNMSTRRVSYTIRSEFVNVVDNGKLTDDGFVDIEFITGSDFGDAPASYGSASQNADNFLRMGDAVDSETLALTSSIADGDDRNNQDDEDGVSFSTNPLKRGEAGTVDVTVFNFRQNGATVTGWIDFNRDGTFDNTTEKLLGFGLTFNQSTSTQIKSDSFIIPGDASCGDTIARFILSTDVPSTTGAGTGIGEVEDYVVTISCDPPVVNNDFDYGDAPSGYGDAKHRIIPGLQLGNEIDSEAIALNSADADGDDISGIDDEDGATFSGGATGYLGQNVTIQFTAVNTAYLDAWVSGWADWNQNGVFDAPAETIISNELVPLSATSQSFTKQFTVPTTAACDNTVLRLRLSDVPVDPTEDAESGEAEDYQFFVDCTVEQGVWVTPNLPEVQLEETVELLVEADNQGPNFAPNSVITVTVPAGLEITNVTSFGGWSCAAQSSDTLVVCTIPTMNVSPVTQVAQIDVRVPGTFPLDDIAGTAVIGSDFPEAVGEEADNTATYNVPVLKEWAGVGVPTADLSPFSHATFDSVLQVSAGVDAEADYDADDLIVNPIQVPLLVIPGLEISSPPILTAKYCQTHTTGGCTTATAILTGTVRVLSYTVDTMILQTVDAVGNPQDDPSAVDLMPSSEVISYGALGDGRFVEDELPDCLNWIGQMGTGGNCEARYDVFTADAHADAMYIWNTAEYLELLILGNGGRDVACSGAAGACVRVVDGRPGLYRISGSIDAQLIFNDPVYQRIGPDPYIQDFSYPFTIYVNIVSTFVESE